MSSDIEMSLTSASVLPESVEAEKTAEEEAKEAAEAGVEVETVSCFKLFRFTTFCEKIVVVIGMILTTVNALLTPLFATMLGEFIHFGSVVCTQYIKRSNDTVYNFTVGTPAPSVQPFSMDQMTMGMGPGDGGAMDTGQMIGVVVLITFSAILMGVIGFISAFPMNFVGMRLSYNLRIRYLKAVFGQDMTFFDTTKAGKIVANIGGDMASIQKAISSDIPETMRIFIGALASIGVALYIEWRLSLVMLAPTVVLMGAMGWLGTLMGSLVKKQIGAYSYAGSVAGEAIDNVRTVAAFNGQKHETDRYVAGLIEARDHGIKSGCATGPGWSSYRLVTMLSVALAFWYGCSLVMNGELRGADVLTLFYLMQNVGSVGFSSHHLNGLQKACVAAAKIYKIIDRRPDIDVYSTEGHKPSEKVVQGHIEFKNVGFKYPTRDEVEVLRGMSFVVGAGQTVALVGQSGSGKSTTFALLQRFYDALEGQIEVDGHDVREYNVAALRKQFGVVNQEPCLFAASIRENILNGEPDASEDDMIAAAKAAHIHDFIMTLEKGYDSQVGEKGTTLSGGQKQRIAIARAIIKDPPILLLDEATSALDSESEELVAKALKALSSTRTTLVIAHRLSTIQDADKIVVVHKGRVLEEGSHYELLANDTSNEFGYAALCEAQNLQTLEDCDTPKPSTPTPKSSSPNSPDDFSQENDRAKSAAPISKMVSAKQFIDELLDIKRDDDPAKNAHSEKVNDDGDAKIVETVKNQESEPKTQGPQVTLELDPALKKKDISQDDDHVGAVLEFSESKVNDKAVVVPINGQNEEEGKEGDKEKGEEEEADAEPEKCAIWKYNKPEFPLFGIGIFLSFLSGGSWPMFAYIVTEMLDIFYSCNELTGPLLLDVVNPCAVSFAEETFSVNSTAYIYGMCQTYTDITMGRGTCSSNLDKLTIEKSVCLEHMRTNVDWWCLGFAICGVVGALAEALGVIIFTCMGEHLTHRLREASFKNIVRQNIAWFDEKENSTGSLTFQLSTDAALVQNTKGKQIGKSIDQMCSLAVALIICFVTSWQLTLVMVASCIVMFTGMSLHTQLFMGDNPLAKKLTNADIYEEGGAIVQDHVSAIRAVKSLGMERHSISLYTTITRPAYDAVPCKASVAAALNSITLFGFFLIMATTFSYAFYLIGIGMYTIDAVNKVFFVSLYSVMMLAWSMGMSGDTAAAQTAGPKILKLINREPEIDVYDESGDQLDRETAAGVIEFKDIVFRYPTRPNVPVLQGISFKVLPRQTVALVGASGSGKSTIVSLLERFYDPKEGSITIGGRDITSVTVKSLREHIGIVTQEPILFGTSIKSNIAYGSVQPQVHDDEVQDAAEKANIAKFITGLPSQYNTKVGSRGSQLSGGQKQRVAIARAVIRRPSVLLLDEATSALDTESEAVVQAALDDLMQECTTIVIAHRLSTIQNADLILVVEDGRIVDSGTHKELLQSECDIYRNLVSKQVVKKTKE